MFMKGQIFLRSFRIAAGEQVASQTLPPEHMSFVNRRGVFL